MQKGIKSQNMEGQSIFIQSKGNRRALVIKDLARKKEEKCSTILLDNAKRAAKLATATRKANYSRQQQQRDEYKQPRPHTAERPDDGINSFNF